MGGKLVAAKSVPNDFIVDSGAEKCVGHDAELLPQLLSPLSIRGGGRRLNPYAKVGFEKCKEHGHVLHAWVLIVCFDMCPGVFFREESDSNNRLYNSPDFQMYCFKVLLTSSACACHYHHLSPSAKARRAAHACALPPSAKACYVWPLFPGHGPSA